MLNLNDNGVNLLHCETGQSSFKHSRLQINATKTVKRLELLVYQLRKIHK